jgi:hypothetical protein
MKHQCTRPQVSHAAVTSHQFIQSAPSVCHISDFDKIRVVNPQMIRAAIQEHTGVEPPPRPPPPRVAAYGTINFTQTAPLLANMQRLAGGAAVNAEWPDIMEEYGQR